jgi:hypothetical protein
MTEEEAKTKSCCGPMQAEFGKTHVVNCIGSACMAWRWDDFIVVDGPGDEHHHMSDTQGFCGLAGRP